MKTDLRSEINKMDNYEFDETTINEDLGIDPEKIKADVMQRINAQKPKKNRKGFALLLIAAVISTALIGTTVMAAAGVFSPKLNDIYRGDTSFLEVHGTDEFIFESEDDNLSAEFVGITTIDDETIASVVLTKKDDSPFTDADHIESNEKHLLDDIISVDWYSPGDNVVSDLKKNPNNIDYAYAYYKNSKDGKMLEYSSMAVNYILSDDKKSIRLYIKTEPSTPEEPETYVNVVSRYAQIYHSKNKIGSYSMCDGNETPIFMNDFTNCIGDIENKYIVREKNSVMTIYSADEERLSLPYYIRIKIDYSPEDDDLTIRSAVSSETAPGLMKKGSADLKITPTKIYIAAENTYTIDEINRMQSVGGYFSEEDKYTVENPQICFPFRVSAFVDNFNDEYDPWTEIDEERSRVVMTDGTVYYLNGSSSMGCDYDKETDLCTLIEDKTLTYSYYPSYCTPRSIEDESGIVRQTIINTNEIAKVVINSDTVYTKEGYEDTVVSIPEKTINIKPKITTDSSEPDSNETDKFAIDFNGILSLKERIMKNLLTENMYYCEDMSMSMYEPTDNSSIEKMVYTIMIGGGKDDLKRTAEGLCGELDKYLYMTELSLKEPLEPSKDYTLTITLENPKKARGAKISDDEILEYINNKYESIDTEKLINDAFA